MWIAEPVLSEERDVSDTTGKLLGHLFDMCTEVRFKTSLLWPKLLIPGHLPRTFLAHNAQHYNQIFILPFVLGCYYANRISMRV